MSETAAPAAPARARAKRRTGVVVSDAMDKTIVVTIRRLVQHGMYKKYVRRDKKLYVHDSKNEAKVGDTVEVAELTRPLSKTKRWRLARIVERAK